jgi:LacI family transcriptional regulator, galactose operon repressor
MATIRDVAQAAGVSVATVSRVVNGTATVADATRARVEQVVAKLEYWPHGAAQSLNTSRTHTLGVLLPDLYGQFFSEVIRGVDQGAREHGFQILVSSSHADVDTLMTGARAMAGRVDGLIVMAPDQATTAGMARLTRRFPVILLNPHHPVDGCSTISVANFQGAVDVVSHLIRNGHRSIGIVKGPKGNMDAEERLRGYRHALRKSGFEANPAFEFAGDFSEASGFMAGQDIAKLRSRPSAVFATNDGMATGLLSALRQHGVDVPQDIAVVGFDDIPIAQFLNPGLTTVHVDAFALGQHAVQMLVGTLRGTEPAPPRHETLPVKLILRHSSRNRSKTISGATSRSRAAPRSLTPGGGN